MKKLLAILMAVSAVFLFSCSNESGGSSSNEDNENGSSGTNGTTSNGQTIYTNTYTNSATIGTVDSACVPQNLKDHTFTATFYLNFPADDDTYFYKCYSGLKDGYTITYYDGSKITMPNPSAYYVQYKKSDNTLNAVSSVLYWIAVDSIIDCSTSSGTETAYFDRSKYYTISDNATFTANYIYDYLYETTPQYAQIANVYESSNFNWDGKSEVYLYHSLDCKESYTIMEDTHKIITDITDYFVNFDGDACDENPEATAKIKLDGTDKILTITFE